MPRFRPATKCRVAAGTETVSHRGDDRRVIQSTDPRHLFCAGSQIERRRVELGLVPVIRAVRAAGALSFASIGTALNDRCVRSSRGDKWHSSSVARCAFSLESSRTWLGALFYRREKELLGDLGSIAISERPLEPMGGGVKSLELIGS